VVDVIKLLNDLTGGQLLLWKALLTSVIFACAGFQVLLAARFYEASTVPPISTGAAARTHRLNGKLTVTLAVVVGLSCLVGPAGPNLPWIGSGLFLTFAAIWATSVADYVTAR
jgi:hypothetical protein